MTFIEKRLWLIVTISVLLLTAMPYLYGHLTEPPDRQFMGVLLNVPDYAQYQSWFREFKTANLISNKLTPEPNDPIFFNLLWWVLGRLSQFTGMGFKALHELLRLFAGFVFFGALYAFCKLVLPDPKERKTAFLLSVFGAGFGWVLVLLKYTVTKGKLLYPLDVFIAEPNSFLCIMAFPHFILANALIVIVFSLSLAGYQKIQLRYATAAGIAGLFLSLQHAYDLLPLYCILGTFTFLVSIRDRKISWFLVKSNLIVGLISWWPGVYSLWLTRTSPIWKGVLAQFANAGVYTPTPFHLVILMGLPLLLAVLTFDGFLPLSKSSDEILFVKGWLLTGFLLLYIPTDFQVHMLNSWQIPVAVLAARAFCRYIIPVILEYSSTIYNKRLFERSLIAGLLLFASLTNIYLFAWRFADLSRHNYPYYLYNDEIEAMNWLDQHAESEDIVLSSMVIGHYIPAVSGNTAFLAHWAQTLDFFEKRDQVTHFFHADTTDEKRSEILNSFPIRYVFHGPAELALGSHDPASSPLLELVYSNSTIRIFRVKEH
jgi:hypothetical protein